MYHQTITKKGRQISIAVARLAEQAVVEEAIIQYTLSFRNHIGSAVDTITCTLFSNANNDIYTAWDAIEDALQIYSSYKTMFDVYGHFTEPHPIFELKVDVLAKEPAPLVLFAKRFSVLEANSRILPKQALYEFFGDTVDEAFDLSQAVRTLRDLRFDVRSNETNASIPAGYFRCCYPFTISLHRQVSVTWKERGKENIMPINPKYQEILTSAFTEAQRLVPVRVTRLGDDQNVAEVPLIYDNADSLNTAQVSLAEFMNQSVLAHPLKTIRDSAVEPLGVIVHGGAA